MTTTRLLLAASLVLACTPAAAAPYTGFVVLGDSLSDTGNLTAIVSQATGGALTVPVPPYAPGRASNGPVTPEIVAALLGLPAPLPAALPGGSNYAVIGAATGPVPLPLPGDPANTADNVAELMGLPLPSPTGIRNAQLPSYLSSLQAPIDPQVLFMIWGGSNDLFIDPTPGTAMAAAGNVVAVVDALYGFGARHFLVPNLPNLGLTPAAGANAPVFDALTQVFNTELGGQLASRAHLSGLRLTLFDTYAYYSGILANPGAAGFTNVTDACVAGNVLLAQQLCGQEDEASFLFWDSTHPTTAAHQQLAGQMVAALQAPEDVAEPGTLTLAALGVAVAAWRRRRAA